MTPRSLVALAEAFGFWALTHQALEARQRRKLRHLVLHAYRHVPFYRSLWDEAGVRPEAIEGPEDLARLPLVSKRDLVDRPLHKILAAGIKLERCVRSSSSGTSGEPLTVYFFSADRSAMNMGWFRAYIAHGLRPTDTMAAFIGRREVRRNRRWYELLGLFERQEISTWRPIEEWVTELAQLRPQAITGYVMTLRLLAEYVRDHPEQRVVPRLIFHTSALLDENSRRLLSQQFRCPVVDIYGSEEGGCIAWECPKCSGYHVNTDLVIVEILRDGRPAPPGEIGEVVVTNLHSHAMPLIRYRQGDLACWSQGDNVCGRPFPLLSRIEGRVEDFIVLSDGRRLPPHPFYHCIDPVPGVRRWRIVQREAGAMVLEMEVPDCSRGSVRETVLQELTALTGGKIQVHIVFRDKLTIEPGRKFRSVSSLAGRFERQADWG